MKNILITGALRGIGRSVLEVLHQESYKIFAIYNSSEDLKKAVAEHFENVEMYKADLSSRSEILDLVQKLKNVRFFGVINVAGIALGDTTDSLNMEMWDRTMAVNLTAPLLLSTQLAPNIEPGGSIVNIASLYGALYGMNMSLSYGASKAALINVTKSLSYQLRQKNIRVNAIAPGIVDTDMTAQDTKEMLAEVSHRSGLGRIAKPEEIAHIVAFLISEKASYINGHTIVADGGYSAWDGIY